MKPAVSFSIMLPVTICSLLEKLGLTWFHYSQLWHRPYYNQIKKSGYLLGGADFLHFQKTEVLLCFVPILVTLTYQISI